MNEQLLQYLWNFKVFKNFNFICTDGSAVEILDFGTWNFDAGPDFLFAKIRMNGIIIAGHIELHVRASDWIFHHHSADSAYDNVILHVVYQADAEVPELLQKNTPTLEIRQYIDESVTGRYAELARNEEFIPCENLITTVDIPLFFAEESLLKKLETKAEDVDAALRLNNGDFEAVLFHALAYAFGLKVNAAVFRQLAESIPFSVVRKTFQNLLQLEALLLGSAGWLQTPADEQMKLWRREYEFLQAKYSLPNIAVSPKFSRLRPPNFPTLRLSQLANLYHNEQNLFSRVMAAESYEQLCKIFSDVVASPYWDSRFVFNKISGKSYPKTLSSDFIDLIIINALLPLKYAYQRKLNEEAADDILEFYRAIQPESNAVIRNWSTLNIPVKNALDSQAFLYHYQNFCKPKKCLNCSIAFKILKKNDG